MNERAIYLRESQILSQEYSREILPNNTIKKTVFESLTLIELKYKISSEEKYRIEMRSKSIASKK